MNQINEKKKKDNSEEDPSLLQSIWQGMRDNQKKLSDRDFDNFVRDGKNSAKEREKLDALKSSSSKKSSKLGDIWRGFQDGMANDGESKVADYYRDTNSDTTNATISDEKSSSNGDQSASNDAPDTNTSNKKIEKLSAKSLQQIHKSILAMDKQEKIKTYKALLNIYNSLTESELKEAFDNLRLLNKQLTNDELIMFLKYVNTAYLKKKSKNKSNIVENDTKLPNNAVTRKWKEFGSPRDKEGLIKIMKFFKLSDAQIYNTFNKIKKHLTYAELERYDIDVSNKYSKISQQDLQKFANTLGKSELKKVLLNLKKDIES